MPDDLEIVFLMNELFVNEKTKEIIPYKYKIAKEIPP
jgi:hypothetical protein